MPDTTSPEIIKFRSDMTLRWPCRAGDFLLWFGHTNMFAGPEAIKCYDLWEMRDGYHVTITNRLADLPPWFRLHPTEVCGGLVYKLLPKVEKGDYPSAPMEGPNLWRLKSGDRVAWVGADRPDRRSVNGILAILDSQVSALAVGEAYWESVESFAGFGAPTTEEMKPEGVARCQAALGAVKKLGLARGGGEGLGRRTRGRHRSQKKVRGQQDYCKLLHGRHSEGIFC